MARIFVSYRRDDSAGETGHLAADLQRRFGTNRVFLDIAAIRPSVDFRLAIEEALDDASVLLVVIGPNWLSAVDASGTRRLDDPGDFVRLEIAAALRRRLPVMPVLVRGANIPEPKDLPDEIQALGWRQAVELSHKRWDYDVGQIISALEKIVEPSETSSASDTLRPPSSGPRRLAAAFAALGLLGAFATYVILSSRAAPVSPLLQPTVVETRTPSDAAASIPVTFDVWCDLVRAPANRNVVKLGNRLLAVVIHGRRDVDVHQIDLASVRVSDGTGSGVPPALYFLDNDEDKDGLDDAKFDIKLDDLRTSANLAGASTVLQVWGRFKNQRPFRGDQRVRFIP